MSGMSEGLIRRKDGSDLFVEASVALLGDGNIMGMIRDVSRRKRAEEQVAASLREKEVLLKEIHHRVKNNLQIISSLLSLQADHIDDPLALAKFRESQERINSIALLHESLYRSADFARIDIAHYIQRLATNLSDTYCSTCESRVKVNVQVSHLLLDLGTAMPCGLIITELLTNSIKYAFPEGQEGEVYVRLDSDADGAIALTIGDTGVGLPPDTVLGQTDSLGLQLVDTLVKQLKGTIVISRELGTQFHITFTPQTKTGTP
jgi:two-component sensor histidine kinase